MIERLEKDTTCPHCTEELDDVDGVFFDKMADKKQCPNCEHTIEYVKQFSREYENPYCDYVWDKTYIIWEYDK